MSEPGDTEVPEKIRVAASASGLGPLNEKAVSRLCTYISLILRWNVRVNLTAVRDEDAMIERHLIESIYVSSKLPTSVRTLLDFGSGAGLPGIPIAICQPDLKVTLAESQNKKAAFLMEVVRVLGLHAIVYSGRAEEIAAQFDCVTLRAVDKMPRAVTAAAQLVAPGGWLAPMTTLADEEQLKAAAGAGFSWQPSRILRASETRVLLVGQKDAEVSGA